MFGAIIVRFNLPSGCSSHSRVFTGIARLFDLERGNDLLIIKIAERPTDSEAAVDALGDDDAASRRDTLLLLEICRLVIVGGKVDVCFFKIKIHIFVDLSYLIMSFR